MAEEEQKPLEEMDGDELFQEYMAIKDDAFKIKRITKIKQLGKNKFKRNFFEEGDVNFKPKPELSPSEFGTDVAMSGGSGLARGVAGAIDTPAHLTNLAVAGADLFNRKVLGNEQLPEGFSEGVKSGFRGALPVIGDLYDFTEPQARMAADKAAPEFMNYDPKSTTGEAVQRVGEFLPFAGKNVVTMGVLPALTSLYAGKQFEGTAAEVPAEIITAIVTPILAKKIISPQGGEITGQTKKYVDLLKKEGVIPTAGTMLNDAQILAWEEATKAGRNMQEAAVEAFSRAALKRIGINKNRVEAADLEQVYKDINKGYRETIDSLDISKGKMVPTQNQLDDLKLAFRDYKGNVNMTTDTPIIRQVFNVLQRSLETGQSLSKNQMKYFQRNLNAMTRKGDVNGDFARRAVPVLNEMIHKNLGKEGKAKLLETNRLYRDFLAIEKTIDRGEGFYTGLVTPQKLATATSQVFKRDKLFGRSDLAELSRAGSATMKTLPQAGNYRERLNAGGMAAGQTQASTGAAGFGFTGDPAVAATAYAAGSLLAPMRNRAMTTGMGQEYLKNQLITNQGEMGLLRMLGASTLPNM